MATLNDMTRPLTPENYFHIYNRGNGGVNIFYEPKNYLYFLKKHAQYMESYWDTFAYCLLPNHFHLLIRVKPKAVILETASKDFKLVSKSFFVKLFPKVDLPDSGTSAYTDLLSFEKLANLSPAEIGVLTNAFNCESFQNELAQWAVSERFRRLMLGYAKAINKQENRSGSLFQKLFKRKRVSGIEGCKNVCAYIHRNGVHHQFCNRITEYPWSSYNTLLSGESTLLKRDQVFAWYGGSNQFVHYHKEYVEDWKQLQELIIED